MAYHAVMLTDKMLRNQIVINDLLHMRVCEAL